MEATGRWEPAGRTGPSPAGATTARVVVVTGGKGGVGKSNFSLNFSLALCERGRRVLLVDGDSGLGSLDVLLGICPERHLGHVLRGSCSATDALVRAPLGLHLLAAASGLQALGDAAAEEVARLGTALGSLSGAYDVCVLDAGAGLGPLVHALLAAASERIVVTTPEPTALADAYATCKAIIASEPRGETWLLINMAESAAEAEAAARGIVSVCRGYLAWSPRPLGWVPRDPRVCRSVREQRPFLLASEQGPAARAMRGVAAAFCSESPVERGPGLRDLLLSLVQRVGGAASGCQEVQARGLWRTPLPRGGARS